MSKTKCEEMQDLFTSLKSKRETGENARRAPESRWRDAVQYVLPLYTDFWEEELEDKRIDTTATECVHLLADGMIGNVCPPNSPWVRFRFAKNELNDDSELCKWLEEVQERLNDAIERSNFYDAVLRGARVASSFGPATMLITEDVGEGRIDCIIPDPVEVYLITDKRGRVNGVIRRYTMTARQIAEEFGEDNGKYSQSLKNCIEKNPENEFTVYHAIVPRKERRPDSHAAVDMPFASYHWEDGGNEFIRESGYKTFAAPTWRYELRGNDPYGYCPTDDAMPEIKMLNQMRATLLLAAEKNVDPALDIPEERGYIDRNPGGSNFYRDGGRPISRIPGGEGFPLTLEMMQDSRERIRKIYKVEHFLSLVQQDKQMTAREVFERKAEKITVSGSSVGMFQEWIGQILNRFLQIEFDAKRMPPPPAGQEGTLNRAELKIEYIGPFAQASKEIASAQGIINTLSTSAIIFELWEETKDKVKPDVLIDQVFSSGGMPEKALRSEEEYKAVQQAKAKQQQDMLKMQMDLERMKAYPGMTKRPEPGSPAQGG